MNKSIIVKKKFLLMFLLILFLLISKFYHSFLNINLNKYEKRINLIYGFCGNESIGYLKHLKKNFNLNDNPKIINYIHTPPVEWSIFDPINIGKNSDSLILLNYPGKIIEFNIERKKKNILEINNLNFYKDKIKKINNISIKLKKPLNINELKIDLLSEINFGERKLIRSFNKNYNNKNRDKEIDLIINLEMDRLYSKNENIAFRINDINDADIAEIKILGENRHIIEKLNVVDSYENCYFVKND